MQRDGDGRSGAKPPKSRAPSFPVTVALRILVECADQRLAANELALRMHQAGYDGQTCGRAIASLERRGWARRDGGMVALTDKGRAAITRPAATTAAAPRQTHRRMPRGLFQS